MRLVSVAMCADQNCIIKLLLEECIFLCRWSEEGCRLMEQSREFMPPMIVVELRRLCEVIICCKQLL